MEMEERRDMKRRKYNISTLKNKDTMHLGCWFDKGNQPMIEEEEEKFAQEDSNYDLILLMVTTISHESCNLEGWFLVKGNHGLKYTLENKNSSKQTFGNPAQP